MSTLTMLDRGQAPPATTALAALETASRAAGTPAPGAWAFYLGGDGHNGGHGSTWTNGLLDELQRHGVHLLPVYVGRQGHLSRARGVSDGQDAVALHRDFHQRNTMIVADVESHTSDADPAAAVEYVGGWTEALHAAGLRAMVYGSFRLAADVAAHGRPKPDGVWVARFRAHAPEPRRDPHHIPGVPQAAFAAPGQRAWQYAGAFKDHPSDPRPTPCDLHGINVDVSAVDAEVFGVAPQHPGTQHHEAGTHPTAAVERHVIVAGDTLSALEVRHHLRPGTLFAANRAVLDAAARQHGRPDSDHGNLIFPGTTIVIPRD